MNTHLTVGKDVALDSSLGIVELFMLKNLIWCLATCTAPGPISHTSFVVKHSLGVTPNYVLGLPRQAGDTIGVTESEQKTWTPKTITIHASEVDAQFQLLIGSFGG